ncbi:MAG: hypothetical protein ACTSRH_07265 [Promethearchaeota archaeon]
MASNNKKNVIIKRKGKQLFIIRDSNILNILVREDINKNKLINELIQIINSKISQNGILISFQEIYNELLKKFSKELNLKYVNKILKKLEKRKIIKILKLNKRFKLIQITPFEYSPYIIKILKIASQKPIISLEEISNKINTNLIETEKLLDFLVSKKIVKIQENILYGKRYVFPGLLNSD